MSAHLAQLPSPFPSILRHSCYCSPDHLSSSVLQAQSPTPSPHRVPIVTSAQVARSGDHCIVRLWTCPCEDSSRLFCDGPRPPPWLDIELSEEVVVPLSLRWNRRSRVKGSRCRLACLQSERRGERGEKDDDKDHGGRDETRMKARLASGHVGVTGAYITLGYAFVAERVATRLTRVPGADAFDSSL